MRKEIRKEIQDIKDQTDDIETISRKVARLSADVHEIKKSVGHQTDDDDDDYYDDDDDYDDDDYYDDDYDDDDDDDDEHANI